MAVIPIFGSFSYHPARVHEIDRIRVGIVIRIMPTGFANSIVDGIAFHVTVAIPTGAATCDALDGIESRERSQLRVVVAGAQVLQTGGVGLLAGEAEVGQGGAGGIDHWQRSAVGVVHGAGGEERILTGGEAHRAQAIVAEVAVVLHPTGGFQPLADDIQARPVPGVDAAGIGVGAQDLAQTAAQVQQIVSGHAIEHAPQTISHVASAGVPAIALKIAVQVVGEGRIGESVATLRLGELVGGVVGVDGRHTGVGEALYSVHVSLGVCQPINLNAMKRPSLPIPAIGWRESCFLLNFALPNRFAYHMSAILNAI